MTNIPFPNPHDADALNDYLDSLAAGKSANPESDVETAALEFHQMASRAEVCIPAQPVEPNRGEENMHTATLAAPISNRTRRQMAKEEPPSKSYGWLSAVIVAGLMLSIISAAWLNREPGNPHDQLAFAPGTAEALSHECPVTLPNHVDAPSGLDHFAADGHTWFEDGIWITIPTDGVMRAQLHQQFTDPESQYFGWAFEKLHVLRGEDVQGMVEITGQRLDEESDLRPFNDTTVDEFYGETGFVPVVLMIPGEGCWEFTATVGDATATWVMEVRFVDEEAQPDRQSTPVVATPESSVSWAAPLSYNECPEEQIVQVDRENNPAGTRYTMEDYEGLTSKRDYAIVGLADAEDANDVVTVMRRSLSCAVRNESIQAWSARFEWENRTSEGRISLGRIEDERTEASSDVSDWFETELGLTPMDMVVEQDPNELKLDGSESLESHLLYNPAHAVVFADGRIGIIGSVVHYSDPTDETSQEPVPYFAHYMSIFVYQDGEWMLDENLPVCIGDCSELPNGTPIPGVDPMATPEATSVD